VLAVRRDEAREDADTSAQFYIARDVADALRSEAVARPGLKACVKEDRR
jgi:hypothetical protein